MTRKRGEARSGRGVLIVHPHGAVRGGPATFLKFLAPALQRTGWETVIVVLRSGPLAAELRSMGLRVVVMDAGRLADPVRFAAVVSRLTMLILRERLSLVLSNGAVEHLYGGLAALLTRRQAVWCCHNLWVDLPLSRLIAAVPSSTVIANSELTLKSLPAGRIAGRVVPFGVSLNGGSTDGAADLLQQQEGVRGPSLLCVGGLSELKGQHVLIRALPLIHQRHPGTTVLLAGDAEQFGTKLRAQSQPYAQYLAELAGSLGVHENVHFLGFRQDVDAMLRASDMLVHPSIGPESFGFAIAEAMAAGKPVVAARIGNQQELVRHEETGLLVPPNDPGALAGAVNRLLDDPRWARTLGANGRMHAARELDAERMVHEAEAVLRQAAARQGTSA